tara:strand:+ start:19211 stop:19795 length:585 start_codon:yes stop_codon:yes gene_type:complete
MMNLSDKSNGKMLALGILLIVLLLFYFILIEPYKLLLNASEERVQDTAFQLNQANKVISKKTYYKDEIERLKSLYDEQTIYLKSSKRALATAEIQQMLKRISAKSNAELLSSQATSSETEEANRVDLSVRIKTDIFSLQKLLYDLESGVPNLFVDRIQVSRAGRAVFRFNNAELSNQDLDVSLQVYGYLSNNSL